MAHHELMVSPATGSVGGNWDDR